MKMSSWSCIVKIWQNSIVKSIVKHCFSLFLTSQIYFGPSKYIFWTTGFYIRLETKTRAKQLITGEFFLWYFINLQRFFFSEDVLSWTCCSLLRFWINIGLIIHLTNKKQWTRFSLCWLKSNNSKIVYSKRPCGLPIKINEKSEHRNKKCVPIFSSSPFCQLKMHRQSHKIGSPL